MTAEKEKLLNETYQKILRIGFALEPTLDLREYFSEKLYIIGTTKDEMINTLQGLQRLIDRQKEQSAGLEISFTSKAVDRQYYSEDTMAVMTDEITAHILSKEYETSFDMRSSGLLKFEEGKWKLVYWHASKPENVQSEEDTFGINEWKEKNAQLERLVAERTSDLLKKNEELKAILDQLQATQTQLIHSEKMASLGELTAGIAHEIQNPLNFVNNFSEINRELLAEMNEAIAKKDYTEVEALAKDITENEEKITHHGKRADAIVKGMLQHSRSSSAVKELTDINQLADEYLRLAYHGLRAKDKSFNATMNTSFDENVGKANVISQDIGRVILNLITNAFYAVNQRKQNPGGFLPTSGRLDQSNAPGSEKTPGGLAAYEPTVSLATKKEGNNIVITVTDNADGISPAILDKIFQPFFTTKPTGQGTGLGLSMSNDIVTKGHGGTLTVKTNEGTGTTFIITLPA
jgi:signal transduction histidine kinase